MLPTFDKHTKRHIHTHMHIHMCMYTHISIYIQEFNLKISISFRKDELKRTHIYYYDKQKADLSKGRLPGLHQNQWRTEDSGLTNFTL